MRRGLRGRLGEDEDWGMGMGERGGGGLTKCGCCDAHLCTKEMGLKLGIVFG
jgi:hypothetical protein